MILTQDIETKNRDKIIIAGRKFKKENPDKIKEYSREYREENRDKLIKDAKEYRENKPHIWRRWRENNKDKVYVYRKRYEEKRSCDEVYIMTRKIRNSIRSSIRSINFKKKNRSTDILGCTMEEFVTYIKSTFLDGMNVENHGLWHLDHIIPISTAKTYEEAIELNHYTNFQALWAIDNLKKSNKIV